MMTLQNRKSCPSLCSEDTESLKDKVAFNWPKCFKCLPKPSYPDADIEAV